MVNGQLCKICKVKLSLENCWIKKSGYSQGKFHTYCKKCNNAISLKSRKLDYKRNPEKYRKLGRDWRLKNPEKARARNVAYYRRYRNLVLQHYTGGKMDCACCGEKIVQFLSVDHMNNDGARHREMVTGKKRSEGGAGQSLYTWLVVNNYPKEFQILCMNCNWGKRLTGICPHKYGN